MLMFFPSVNNPKIVIIMDAVHQRVVLVPISTVMKMQNVWVEVLEHLTRQQIIYNVNSYLEISIHVDIMILFFEKNLYRFYGYCEHIVSSLLCMSS